jgi:hypothetical protein
MANRPQLHDDYLEIIMEGDQTGDAIRRLISQNDAAIATLVSRDQPVLLLVDLTGVGKIHADAFTAAIHTMQYHSFDYHKLAVYGIKHHIIEDMMKALIKMFTSSGPMQIFSDRRQAMDWLGVAD